MGIRTGNRAGKLSEQQRQEINSSLESYFQNAEVGMTKDQYFEMCEQLGSDPIESEIPIEFDDLLLEVQETLHVYNYLQDNWDYMNGNYIGKNLSGFKDVLEISGIEPEYYRSVYEIILTVDRIRQKLISSKQKANNKARS